MQPLKPTDPRVVGRYRLEGRLGAGGMGVVYRGRSPGGRPVAVKIVHEHLLDKDESFRSRFRREIAAARQVGGFWTAAVVDGDADAPSPWYASAYIEAPTLHDVVAERPLAEPEALRLGAQLAEALQAIHAAGLVHRDLKPSNVLMADDGPRVIDFGIVRGVVGDHATAPLTAGVVGTPGYLAPEQLQSGAATAATDVFALGALLVYATTRQLPFRGDTAMALALNTLREEPELGAVPPRLRAVVARCLAKDPRNRPSVDELLDEMTAGPPPAATVVPAPAAHYRPPTRPLIPPPVEPPGQDELAARGRGRAPRVRAGRGRDVPDQGQDPSRVEPIMAAPQVRDQKAGVGPPVAPPDAREAPVDSSETWVRPGPAKVIAAAVVVGLPAFAVGLMLRPVIWQVMVAAALWVLIVIPLSGSVKGYEDSDRRPEVGIGTLLACVAAVGAAGLTLSLQRLTLAWYWHAGIAVLTGVVTFGVVVWMVAEIICQQIDEVAAGLGAGWAGLAGLVLALLLIWGGRFPIWAATLLGVACLLCVAPVLTKLLAPRIMPTS